jgi:hypothetical protein
VLATAYLIKYSQKVRETLPSQAWGMPVSAAGRGGPPGVAAGRGIYAQGLAGVPTAGRGGPPGVAAGRGIYAQGLAGVPTAGRGGPPGVAVGGGMYAQGVAAVSAVASGVAAGAAGVNLATLQHGAGRGRAGKRKRASKADTDARVLAKPRWAKKHNTEQGVVVISDDEDGK